MRMRAAGPSPRASNSGEYQEANGFIVLGDYTFGENSFYIAMGWKKFRVQPDRMEVISAGIR